MELQLGKIVEAFTAFNAIRKSNDLPFLLAWKISDIVDVLKKPTERFQEERLKLIRTYGTPAKDDEEIYHINELSRNKFESELKTLSETKVELIHVKKLKKETLLKSDLKITGEVNIAALKHFIEP